MIVFDTLCAQSAPDAATLLRRTEHALDSHPAFRFQWRSRTKGDGPEGPRFRTEISGSAFGRNDGRSRIESSTGDTATSDGKVTWIYNRRGNSYESGHFMGLRLQLLAQVFGVADVQTVFQDPAGDLREDKIEIDGKARDCWVIATTAPSPWNKQTTTWIDKELWIDWKVVTKQHITVPEVFDIDHNAGKIQPDIRPGFARFSLHLYAAARLQTILLLGRNPRPLTRGAESRDDSRLCRLGSPRHIYSVNSTIRASFTALFSSSIFSTGSGTGLSVSSIEIDCAGPLTTAAAS